MIIFHTKSNQAVFIQVLDAENISVFGVHLLTSGQVRHNYNYVNVSISPSFQGYRTLLSQIKCKFL